MLGLGGGGDGRGCPSVLAGWQEGSGRTPVRTLDWRDHLHMERRRRPALGPRLPSNVTGDKTKKAEKLPEQI